MSGKLILAFGSGVLTTATKKVADGVELLFAETMTKVVEIKVVSCQPMEVRHRELWVLHGLGLLHSRKLRPEQISFVEAHESLVEEWRRLGVDVVVDRENVVIAYARSAGIRTVRIGSAKYLTIASVAQRLTSESIDAFRKELDEQLIMVEVSRD